MKRHVCVLMVAGMRLKLDFPLYATFGDVHKGIRMSLGISMPVGTK